MRFEARHITSLAVAGGWRWPNFKASEFASRDTGRIVLETDFLDRLQAMRTRWARPMVLTSGYRTPDENARKSTTGRDGAHTTGRAVDIVVNPADRFAFIKLAIEMGFTGIGVGRTFVHLDDLTDQNPRIVRPWLWTY